MMLYKQFLKALVPNFHQGLHGLNERARRREVVVYITTNSRTIARHNVAVMAPAGGAAAVGPEEGALVDPSAPTSTSTR
jgi:hypothetical protein